MKSFRIKNSVGKNRDGILTISPFSLYFNIAVAQSNLNKSLTGVIGFDGDSVLSGSRLGLVDGPIKIDRKKTLTQH